MNNIISKEEFIERVQKNLEEEWSDYFGRISISGDWLRDIDKVYQQYVDEQYDDVEDFLDEHMMLEKNHNLEAFWLAHFIGWKNIE